MTELARELKLSVSFFQAEFQDQADGANIDQVLLTVSQDLFFDPPDLAVAHKLASVLRQKSNSHPTWHLPELSEELEVIAKNKRRFIGFSDVDVWFAFALMLALCVALFAYALALLNRGTGIRE